MDLKAWFLLKALSGKLPLWMYRLIGRHAAKILKMEDDKMAEITEEAKPWYKSKGKVGGLGLVLCGAINGVADVLNLPFRVPLWVLEVLTGVTGWGIRDAIVKK